MSSPLVLLQRWAAQLIATLCSGMHSMATANALLCLPALREGAPNMLPASSTMDAILLGPVQ